MPVTLRSSLAVPARLLAWLGRQGTRAIAALVFLGIALPPVGTLLRPFVTEAVFLLLCLSFMRVDPAALRAQLRRPGVILAATAWSALAVPAIAGLAGLGLGLDRQAPALFLALMLQAMASPMMAAPALAALMGLDATLVLITLVTGTALLPLTAPLFAQVFLGGALAIAPLALGLKLCGILGGALAVALLLRRVIGAPRIARHRDAIDGINILILFVFVAAVMGDVAGAVLRQPLTVLALALLAFAAFFVLLGATALIFRGLGRERALALGLMVAQRNMGLMLAATNGALPGLTWLYVALSQFPIYLSPQLLKPLVRRRPGARPDVQPG